MDCIFCFTLYLANWKQIKKIESKRKQNKKQHKLMDALIQADKKIKIFPFLKIQGPVLVRFRVTSPTLPAPNRACWNEASLQAV